MTARHIDATDKTDGSHVVKILWNENDGERELTVRMPAAGTDATAIVGGVQKRLTDKVEIIWGLNFTDEDVLRATVLLAIQQK